MGVMDSQEGDYVPSLRSAIYRPARTYILAADAEAEGTVSCGHQDKFTAGLLILFFIELMHN
jgi:hypothetical protein